MNESENTSINKLRCNLLFLLGLIDSAERGLNDYDKIVQNDGVISSKVWIQKHGESTQHPTKTIGIVSKHEQWPSG